MYSEYAELFSPSTNGLKSYPKCGIKVCEYVNTWKNLLRKYILILRKHLQLIHHCRSTSCQNQPPNLSTTQICLGRLMLTHLQKPANHLIRNCWCKVGHKASASAQIWPILKSLRLGLVHFLHTNAECVLKTGLVWHPSCAGTFVPNNIEYVSIQHICREWL